jgi:hypothetical protein
MSTVQGGQGNIVTNGLVLNLDAANPRSYPQPYNGTTWQNIAPVSSSLTGSLIGGVTYTGSNGGALVFDGVNDYVLCTQPMGAGDFTFSIWIKKSVNVSNLEFVVGQYTDSVSRGAMMFFQNGNLTMRLGANISGSFANNIIGNVTDGTWKNITSTITRTSNIVSYINGTLVSSTNASTQQGTVPSGTVIGSLFGSSWYLGANLATVSLYNRSLNPSEVLQNFNATRARFGI